MTGVDRSLPDGRPSADLLATEAGDHPGDRAAESAREVAVLREWLADKDSIIADLRHRLDVADRRLDAAADDRRLVDELRTALADVNDRSRAPRSSRRSLPRSAW
jgi:hypothetical protein